MDLFGLSVFMEREHAIARFIQRYRDPAFSDVGEKTLILEKADGQWLIIAEQWKPLAADAVPPAERPAPAPVSPAPVSPAPSATGIETLFGPDSHGGIACITDAGVEKVYVRLKDFFIPKIFNINGQKPRIVIDIKNVSHWPGRPSVPVHGRLIRQVRSHLHSREKRLRIVLDLEPSRNYQVSQTYYKAENVYCVEVSD